MRDEFCVQPHPCCSTEPNLRAGYGRQSNRQSPTLTARGQCSRSGQEPSRLPPLRAIAPLGRPSLPKCGMFTAPDQSKSQARPRIGTVPRTPTSPCGGTVHNRGEVRADPTRDALAHMMPERWQSRPYHNPGTHSPDRNKQPADMLDASDISVARQTRVQCSQCTWW